MGTYLRRQLLGQTFTGSVQEAVEAVGGINAQTPRAPSVALWTRMAEFDQCQLDELLRRYELVKANLLRGTVHLVTRRQFVTWRTCLQPALERTVRQFCPGLWKEVDHDELLHHGTELLRASVSPGLTRAEIGAELVKRFPCPVPSQLGFAIRLLLPVVQVADQTSWRPGRTRYILAEQAFPDELAGPAIGQPDLLRTFLRAFGPASAADASYWSGLTGVATTLTALSGPTASGVHDAEPVVAEDPRPTYVLPEFDNVFFCTKRTDAPLIAAKRRLVNPPGHMPGVLVTGDEVCAQWKWKPKTRGGLEITPWRRLGRIEKAEFERFEAWCARP